MMRKNMIVTLAATAGCLSVASLLSPAVVEANPSASGTLWVQRAHNATRLAFAEDGPANKLTLPRVVARLFSAGIPETSSVALGELDEAAGAEQVGIDGGRVLAVRRDLSLMWTSDDVGADRILAIDDLDGDSANEVVVAGGGQLTILSGESGQTLFSLGFNGGPWALGDLDGDAVPELVVQGGEMAGVRAFGFTGGVENGQLLWQFIDGLPQGPVDMAFGDVDGDDNDFEVILDGEGGRVMIINASDGQMVSQSADGPIDAGQGCGPVLVANVDEDPQNELIYSGTSADDGQSVFLAVYDAVDDVIQWSYEYGNDGDEVALRLLEESVQDLNGDGVAEVIVSVFNNTNEVGGADVDAVYEEGRWATIVYDGGTGEARSVVRDHIVTAVVTPKSGMAPLVLAQEAAEDISPAMPGSSLKALSMQGETLQLNWSLNGGRLARAPRVMTASCARPAALMKGVFADLNEADGLETVVERDVDADGRADLLQVLNLAEDGTTVLSQRSLRRHHTPRLVDVGQGFFEASAHLAMTLADGFLTVTSAAFSDVTRFVTARYNAEPRILEYVVRTQNEEDETEYTPYRVLGFQDRTGFTRTFDLEGGSPTQVWVSDDGELRQPMVALYEDFASRMIILDRDGNSPRINAIEPDGEFLWSHTLTDAQSHARSVVAFGVDGSRYIVYLYTNPEGVETIEVLDALLGDLLHNAPVPEVLADDESLTLLAVDDGDGEELLVIGDERAVYLSTDTLEPRGDDFETGPGAVHSLAFDFDGDEQMEVFINSSEGSKKMYDLDVGQLEWELDISDPGHSYHGVVLNYPGVVNQIGDLPVSLIIGGSTGSMTAYNAADGEVLWRTCLANGEHTPMDINAPDLASDCDGGLLTDVALANLILDLDAESDTEELVVGSSDGFLYLMNPQTGEMVWSYDMGAPVSAPIVGSPVVDAPLTVVASAANGNIFVFGPDQLPPALVRDVEVAGAQLINPEQDVATITRREGLGVSWTPVDGALSYRVSVLGDDGVVRPAQTSSRTNAVVSGLNLKVGATYVARVTAVNEDGVESAPTFSDGVTLEDNLAPEIADFLATPSLFSPVTSEPIDLTASLTDDLGLSRISLEAKRDEDEAPAWTRELDGQNRDAIELNTRWDGVGDDDAVVPDGDYTLLLTVEDFGGNTTTATTVVTVDATAPPVPVLLVPEQGAVIEEVQPVISGTAEAGASLALTLNGETLCELTVDDTGAFECEVAEALTEGEQTVTATAADALGNTSEAATLTFSVDLTPPNAPVITSPVDGEMTEDQTPEIAGSAEAGSSVTVFLADTETALCTVAVDDEGNFGCESEVELEFGEQSIVAQATDVLERASENSVPVTFTVIEPAVNPNNEANNEVNNAPNNEANNEVNNAPNNEANNSSNNGVNNDPGPVEPNVTTGNVNDSCACSTPSRPASPGTPALLLTLAAGLILAARRRLF